MHARKRTSLADDLGFLGGQLVESNANGFARCELLGKADIGRVVPRLTLEQAGVEIGQFGVSITDMVAEQTEAFAAAGLDQRRDQQSIDGSVRFVGSNQGVEAATIGPRGEPAEFDAPFVQQMQHHLEVFEFLFDNPRHLATNLAILGIGVHQIHRGRRRLAFAVGMIDQDFVQVLVDLDEPTSGRFRLQVEHGLADSVTGLLGKECFGE